MSLTKPINSFSDSKNIILQRDELKQTNEQKTFKPSSLQARTSCQWQRAWTQCHMTQSLTPCRWAISKCFKKNWTNICLKLRKDNIKHKHMYMHMRYSTTEGIDLTTIRLRSQRLAKELHGHCCLKVYRIKKDITLFQFKFVCRLCNDCNILIGLSERYLMTKQTGAKQSQLFLFLQNQAKHLLF